eukprot:m.251614 g.251614  ORF g.251614 m.251614 type:complete len:549 (+) comp15457_c0_seq2:115-1761(+)
MGGTSTAVGGPPTLIVNYGGLGDTHTPSPSDSLGQGEDTLVEGAEVQFVDEDEVNADRLQCLSKCLRKRTRNELYHMLKLAVPVSTATVFRLAVFLTDSVFLGHLGTDQLAGASLASVVFMIALMFVYGSSSAVNTLCSQTYGAGNYKLVGVWLQSAIFGVTLLCIPVTLVVYFTEQIVSLVEEDQVVTGYAGQYGRWSCLVVLPTAIYSVVRQYFQVQGIVMPATTVSFLSIFVNIGFNQLFIYGVGSWKGLGFIGSPIASASTIGFQCTSYYVYTVLIQRYHEKTWDGWHWTSFGWKRMKAFMAIAAPSGLATVADESVFQALMMLSAKVSTTAVATLGIYFQWYSIVWAIWWGIGLATQVRVGTLLGERRPRDAKFAAILGSLMTVVAMVVLGAVSLGCQRYLGALFSKDEDVIEMTTKVTPVLVGSYIVYCLAANLVSTLEGLARMRALMITSLLCSFGLTLPIGYALTFPADLGIWGLTSAPACGDTIKALVCIYLLWKRTDWEHESHLAQIRADKEPEVIDPVLSQAAQEEMKPLLESGATK